MEQVIGKCHLLCALLPCWSLVRCLFVPSLSTKPPGRYGQKEQSGITSEPAAETLERLGCEVHSVAGKDAMDGLAQVLGPQFPLLKT